MSPSSNNGQSNMSPSSNNGQSNMSPSSNNGQSGTQSSGSATINATGVYSQTRELRLTQVRSSTRPIKTKVVF
jgi:hypothetical protein